jgi:hypothetical protein
MVKYGGWEPFARAVRRVLMNTQKPCSAEFKAEGRSRGEGLALRIRLPLITFGGEEVMKGV